jgi:hypothetical protein
MLPTEGQERLTGAQRQTGLVSSSQPHPVVFAHEGIISISDCPSGRHTR